jgi:hypothetical protein
MLTVLTNVDAMLTGLAILVRGHLLTVDALREKRESVNSVNTSTNAFYQDWRGRQQSVNTVNIFGRAG